MLKFPKILSIAICLSLSATPALAEKLNLGRQATKAEIKAWDIDVRPDGQGLPDGKGTVQKGEQIFAAQCAACHGDFGEGIDRWPVLAGGADTLKSDDPVKTVGSYWPYASTLFDYINRAMPFGNAQSLKPNQVYAVTAYILYLNEIVEEDFELTKSNFTTIKMPNEKNFFADPRPDTPTMKNKKPCMKNCKKQVKITKRARIIDVTPEENKKPKASH